jgi:hypothetical protein
LDPIANPLARICKLRLPSSLSASPGKAPQKVKIPVAICNGFKPSHESGTAGVMTIESP